MNRGIFKLRLSCATIVPALAGLMLMISAGRADGATRAYLINTPAPDGNGRIVSVNAPTLSDTGQLGFTGQLVDTVGGPSSSDRAGVFRLEADGAITQVARGLQMASGGTETFGASFSSPLQSGDGDMAFTASREGATGTAGVYRGAPLTKIVERLQPASDGNGDFSFFGISGVNEAGQAAFSASLTGTTPSGASNGIFRGDGASIVEIVRATSLTPDGAGTFSFATSPRINENGDVAFFAQTSNSASPTGIYRGAGGPITAIVRQGAAAPAWGGGTDGVYSTISSGLSFNDAGQVLFTAKVSGASSGLIPSYFRSDGVSSSVIFARGLPTPNGSGGTNGTFQTFDPPTLNNQGAAITVAGLAGTSGGLTDNRGIFVSDGATIRQVMRNGDPAPDGNGFLQITSSITALVLNDAGQTVFHSGHTGAAPGTAGGIYFHDTQRGLMTVARIGQSLLGSTVTGLAIVESTPFQSPSQMERSGLNEWGQVAFRFTVAGGAQGLAVWSPPTADFNADGDVDGDDLAIWSTNYGDAPATQPMGDASGDGMIDGADFLVWQREVTSGPTAGGTAVPEPTGLAIAAVIAAAIGSQWSAGIAWRTNRTLSRRG